MCCRKNRATYAMPNSAATYTQPDQYNASPYGLPVVQARRGCCGGRRRGRGGLVRMLVRAVQERREAKQAQLMASNSAAVANETRPARDARALYEPGYPRGLEEYKDDVKDAGEDQNDRKASLDSSFGDLSSMQAPPPSYEMVERSEQGL